jgi:hypothetical protein
MISVILATLLVRAEYPAYALPRLEGVTIAGLPAVTSRIAVDQFGYLPEMEKVAILTDPQKGYNATDDYTPANELELRARNGKVVFRAKPSIWKDGQIHEDSGDKGWWFDFSSVRTPGEYYVFDPVAKLRSPIVRIGDGVYRDVLKAACRMFYYQRLDQNLPEKYAGRWAQKAALTQDRVARSVLDKENPATARDLRGGWMDAGDTNKYPPFNSDTLHSLLYAYRGNPKAFGDDNNIPESGNGLPDFLDELKVQLDWLVRMQMPDGGVPVKMGNIDYNGKYPLELDLRPRYYGPIDSGATIISASIYAHASRVYRSFPKWKDFAMDLERRAKLSYQHYKSNPRQEKSDTGEIKSGIANRSLQDQDQAEAAAAIHLLMLTGDEKYHDAIRANAPKTRQLSESIWSPYGAGMHEALVEYAAYPKADRSLAERIRGQLEKSSVNENLAPPIDADLYRAWMVSTSYHWGSSTVRGSYGFASLLASQVLKGAESRRLRTRAAGMLHSFHGVNPLTAVYLTNMKSYGAELSMMSMYHERFNANSPFANNPAPGYVVGGANSRYTGKAADGQPSVEWLRQQPPAKSYGDFNKIWPEATWELSEPAIYYQAAYIRLLSAFVK